MNKTTIAALRILGPEFAREIAEANKKSREEQCIDDMTDLMIRLGVFDDDFDDEEDVDFEASKEAAGNAVYVYRSIRLAARHVLDTKRIDFSVEDVAPGELTTNEYGCRIFLHCQLRRPLPGSYVEEYRLRRGLPIADVARELFLSVQDGKTSKGSSGLRRQRNHGCSGQAVAALWLAVRDNLDLNPRAVYLVKITPGK